MFVDILLKLFMFVKMLTIKQCLPLLALLAHRVGAGEAREEFGTLGLQHGLQQGLHQAVPVIHLSEEQYHGKASVDDYLKMFPNELLGRCYSCQ